MADIDLTRMAEEAAGGAGASNLEQARTITAWLYRELEWTATDYEQRSVEQILGRRGGNCREVTIVLDALLRERSIPTRAVAELNIHPESTQRQADAEQVMECIGPRGSVFGLRHNDHRWIEFAGDAPDMWLPADATLDLVGVDAWVRGRLGFGGRPTLGEGMLAPFMVFVIDAERRPSADRTHHYLIDAFARVYGGRFAELPAWQFWCSEAERLAVLGAAAFVGELNLHAYLDDIEQLSEIYSALSDEARAAGLT